MNTGFRKRRRGILAATSTLVVAAGIAAASVAGAAQDTTIFASDNGGNCFTTTPGGAPCGAGGPVDITIETGDTVTWDFRTGTNLHNIAAADKDASNPPDADWNKFKPVLYHNPGEGVDTYTFGKPGVYKYVCQLHATAMHGTITVEGDPVETATPTATATATATPTFSATATPTATASASPTATPDDHTSTPAPGHTSAKDSEAPRLQRASVKKVATGAQLRFWLSEPATVTIDFVRKGAKSSTTSAVVQAPAGTRTFVLRTRALRKGTYTVTLSPTDAMGNKGPRGVKILKVAK
ncbi:cupredoxin domain-containing protein [Solirubrobacter soli]|uniref:cupredoxin domain-containing protein n=1 Tax=Solirubrobacter soli TaxID=363832 RepID=UPI000424B8EF|nr:plastocyanin/azurin family copper-binding protein [Solirubrobacter soli]